MLIVLAIFITDSAFPAFGVLAQPNLKENCKVSLTQRGGSWFRELRVLRGRNEGETVLPNGASSVT